MPQRLTIEGPHQLWGVDEHDGPHARIKVSAMLRGYRRWRVIKFDHPDAPWGQNKHHSLRAFYPDLKDQRYKHYDLEDGLYVLQWAQAAYKAKWKPKHSSVGSYWKVLGGRFSPIGASQDELQQEYEDWQRRGRFQLVEGGPT